MAGATALSERKRSKRRKTLYSGVECSESTRKGGREHLGKWPSQEGRMHAQGLS